jgi:hypothetical protein
MPTARKSILLVLLCLLAAPAWSQMTPTRRTTSDGRPLASSLPAAHRTGVHVLAFGELSQHVGDFVRVTTIYGDQREGQLDSVQGKSLNLKKSVGRGYAIQNIEFSQIREVLDFR